VVRPARPEDVPEILAMVRELAAYERSAHEVRATEQMLAELLFGGNTPSGAPAAYCHVALAPSGDADAPALAGMALWFLNASTWMGQHGIYLEDLYVRPEFRGHGLGQALMAHLARICIDRGYARLEWWVLDWNEPAIGFYQRLGARPMDEWTVHRLTGDALRTLAADPHVRD
jgi:GNAT superfamily N-acetyltransferase